MNAEEALVKLKKSWEEYRTAKKFVGELWKTFQQVLTSKLAIDPNISPEDMQKVMLQEAKAKKEELKSRKLRGRNNKSLVLKAEVKDPAIGITKIVDPQHDIIAAAAESNLCC